MLTLADCSAQSGRYPRRLVGQQGCQKGDGQPPRSRGQNTNLLVDIDEIVSWSFPEYICCHWFRGSRLGLHSGARRHHVRRLEWKLDMPKNNRFRCKPRICLQWRLLASMGKALLAHSTAKTTMNIYSGILTGAKLKLVRDSLLLISDSYFAIQLRWLSLGRYNRHRRLCSLVDGKIIRLNRDSRQAGSRAGALAFVLPNLKTSPRSS